MSQVPDSARRGRFSREGRLRRKWAQALEESDRGRALARLREVEEGICADPDRLGHLWPAFVETFLDPSRVDALTEDDLASTEAAAAAFAEPAQTWFRAASARTVRGEERRACALLVQACDEPSAAPALKDECARELARRGAAGDDHLRVYVEHLAATDSPEPAVREMLQLHLEADFEKDPLWLRRASEVAERLAGHHLELPGMHAAMGMHALRVEERPDLAVEHFEAALASAADDANAAIGLAAALLESGEAAQAVELESPGVRAAPLEGLREVATTLVWLDGRDNAACPSTTRGLAELDVTRFAPTAAAEAVGRLHLVEGDPIAAAEILLPLAGERRDRPELNYHAAWAAILTGDEHALAACVERSAGSSAGRAVASLRLAMSPAEESGVTGEVPGSASVEERLETVRTSLGHRLVDGNAPLDELLGSPLLERLPAADRAYWRGLAALTAADREQGRCLLEQAAIEGNHPRAVLALAVDLLRSGERGAIPLLERLPAGFDDGTTALLSAAARSLEGDYATAAMQLESLTSVDGRARLAVANLYLHQAGEAEMAGHSDRARVFREQAAGALEAAEESGLPFPADFALLKRCLAFVAAPREAAEVLAEADSPAQTLEPSARTAWMTWNWSIAGLWAGNGDALAAAEAAVDLLERSGPPLPEAAVALAQAVARIDSAADDADAAAVAARTSDLLERLLRIHDDDGVRSCCRIVATRAARLDAGRRSPDPAHPTGALLAARRLLGSGDRDAAIATLRSSAVDEEVAARCCSRVADLLSGDVPDESRPEVAGPSTEPGLLLLDAASAFAAGEADAGYRALSSAVRSDSAAAERVIALDRWVAPLLAQAARTGGSPPAALVRSIRQAALGASGSDALTLARCSAAAGESDLALELWQAALADVADPAAPERQELAAFLCHVAVKAHRQGDHPTAATVLRRAARVAAGDGDDETAGTRTRRREGAAR